MQHLFTINCWRQRTVPAMMPKPACIYPSMQAVYVITCVNNYQKSHHVKIPSLFT
ncbi:hypothetical protein ENTCAN_06915 [Enterobacter cancerogenus ATCC 35316]|nr:hypothetical protein ENTCAN_06915 [Enterobacter cancerogenus ATCC 35316]